MKAASTLISIVIPVYQEGELLLMSVPFVCREAEKTSFRFEIIIVDDGSTDNSWEVIKQLSGEFPNLRAIRLSRNFGKEAALCAGLENAKGDAVLVIDSDLQHPPEYIPLMVSLWDKEGYEVVEAEKASRGKEPFLYKAAAGFFYKILSVISGNDFRQASDYKLLDRRVADAFLGMKERHTFFRGMISWLGFRHKIIRIDTGERAMGRTKWSNYRLFRLALNALVSFSSFPLHIVTFIGFVFLLISAGLGVHTLYMKISGKAVEGFASVILILLFVGSTIMISLGVIGEYLSRIYEELKFRPRYIISERLNADIESEDRTS